MDCREIEFSPEKSRERIARALRVFPPKVLNKILAFSLYVLGAKRRDVAALAGMPDESVKTAVRVLFRDGLPAFRDRRRSAAPRFAEACAPPVRISARREDEWIVVDFGIEGKRLRIPLAHKIETRTVLLSLLNAGLLSTGEVAATLELSCAHCRDLAGALSRRDVVESLVDKRQGQKKDYRVGPEKKAEIIRQFAARAVTGHSTSSEVLADLVNEGTEVPLSARTVRWHMNKLGLVGIKKTLPELVSTLKKTRDAAS